MRLHEAARGERTVDLVADAETRTRIARQIGVPAVHRLEASVRVRPWLDGAEIDARWSATVLQVCGVGLDEFEQALEGAFDLRVVPAGSRNAPDPEAELTVDPEAPDPPDVLDGDVFDVAAYVVEHVALALDPFPRKPGAVFVQPPEPAEASPFAALLKLKPDGEA
jgi:hypothetical protein